MGFALPTSASVSPSRDRSPEEGAGPWLSWGQALPPCSHPPCPTDLLEARRPLAHECLGEALRVMRQIISRFPLLNTVETLTAAGTLIAKIRGQPAGAGWRGLQRPRGGLPGGGGVRSGL